MRSSFWPISFAAAATGQPQGACHAAQIEARQALPPNMHGHVGEESEEMFQERIRIRQNIPERTIGRITHRPHNPCGTKPDGRQRTRVVVAINGVR